jgi:superoxide dismutase
MLKAPSGYRYTQTGDLEAIPGGPAARRATGGGAGGVSGGGAMPKPPTGYRYTSTGDLEPIPGGPAAAGPNLTPKDIQKREAVLPQARQAVSTVSNTMSIIGETVDRLLANKEGLNGITGLIYGNTPGITDAGRKAVADINQLKNLAFIQGITELRSASKTGAGVGNVSNKEGDRFENLKASLERTQSYGDMVDALKRLKSQSEFTKQALSVFGSGWAWLVQDADKLLILTHTPGQDSPFFVGLKPILGIDVWEHAYYIDYKNRRDEYVKAWWNVVNWERVSELYGEFS